MLNAELIRRPWLRKLLTLAWVAGVFFQANAGVVGPTESVRLKDLGRLQGWREHALVGYGIVGGLAGTGDSPGNRSTRQSLSNLLGQFQLVVPAEQVQSRNVAIVMVTASLPPFAREGDTLDISVTSVGDARSLVGGSLLLTALKAPNGQVFALAQGALQVGGYRHDAQGNLVQKNHPTVGSVPNGATVEVGIRQSERRVDHVTLVLNEPDYTTAERAAQAINAHFSAPLAQARDAAGIEVAVPEADQSRLTAFLARIESVQVTPDSKARVVINERTGVVVSGGDVRIAPISISQGDIRVQVAQTNSASAPPLIISSTGQPAAIPLSNTRLEVYETPVAALAVGEPTTVADLVQSLSRMRTHTRDIISVLRAIKAAGALRAELIVQ